ncbi:PLP-dependent transferase [Paenibacillus psychroresistens]|uniref:homocysteine desulfhydrase n=1 Tax=Paenibacillus psychroresistens TaxID=1778678 RepID=A0A6B8RJN1_9BACL|nr:PLP-dependent aspartate aminotransferase family protein [Paenibacillus psychroresistens]QGQ96470.1 PLP-dependent transferase [Paenibacillus psychroresistens]
MRDTKHQETQFTSVAHDPMDSRHHGSISIPIYQTSLFAFDNHDDFDQAMVNVLDHHVYSRGNNPTVLYLEQKLAELEEGEVAKCFASGMAAISSAIMSVIRGGDHIICTHQVYGPTREFLGSYLERFNIETTFVDGTSMEEWKAAVRPNTKLIYLESPTSAYFQLQDLQALVELAHSVGAITICDGSWATACNQKPLKLGVDMVVHSITKYIAGHSDCLGGVVIGNKLHIDRLSQNEYMLFGGIMTPQSAALVIRGLRTLPLRMQRHEESGLIIAKHLLKQAFVTKVNHPGLISHPQHELALRQMLGFSSLFSFESDEPVQKLREWANRLRYFKIGVSWGGFESLITVKAIEDSSLQGHHTLVRIYVGMESPEDLIRDMNEAWQ